MSDVPVISAGFFMSSNSRMVGAMSHNFPFSLSVTFPDFVKLMASLGADIRFEERKRYLEEQAGEQK
jgi:hypothetical protein